MSKLIIPEPKDLPPGSVPWSRGVGNAIHQVENKIQAAETEQNAAMKGIAATLNSLSDQISDLSQRTIHSSEEVYGSGNVPIGTALPWNTGLRSVTPFTLTSRRKVLIQLIWTYQIDFSYLGTSPAFYAHADIHFDMFINGSRWAYRSIQAFSEQAIVGQSSHLIQTGTMQWWDIVTFNPGNHVAATRVEVVGATSSDGSWEVYSPKVMVQVMEAAD